MERLDLQSHGISDLKRLIKKLKEIAASNNIFALKDIIEYALAFFISRAVILSGLSPFGFAFFVASFTGEFKSIFIFVFILLGYATSSLGLGYIQYIFAMVIFTSIYFLNKKLIVKNKLYVGLAALISIFISGFIKVVMDGFLLYDNLMLIFESLLAFILIYVLKNGFEFLRNSPVERNILSNEEVISIAILFSLVLVGFGEMRIFSLLSIRNVLSILILLILALENGSSSAAAAGVAVGLVNSLTMNNMSILIGCYAFCSMVAGVFKYLGKIGVSLGFILANAIFVVYINGSTEVFISIYEIIMAAVIFMLLPQKSTKILGRLLNDGNTNYTTNRSYYKKIREMLETRLYDITESLKGLGSVFTNVKESKRMYSPDDISCVFDNVAEKVCRDCSLCLKCWEKDFNNTYQIMFGIKEKIEKKGKIDRTDFPSYFCRRCIKLSEFIITINNLYELYKVNMIWYKKVEESRELLSEQFFSVARIIERLNKEITSELKFDENYERDIILILDRLGLEVKNVSVLQNIYGKYEVAIKMKACNNVKKCDDVISKAVSEVIGRRMIKENIKCILDDTLDECFVKLSEKEMYQIQVGVTQKKKKGQAKCGDNYFYTQMDDGRYVLAISDGMGSGLKASEESQAAISLIQKFLSSGFDKNTAVKLINSVLVLKSPEDLFTTIDLSIIDLHDGSAEFSKIGAATTFIKRKDNKVEKIKSNSLPAGILKKIDVENSKNKLNDGDYVIMISDGILDSKKGEIDMEGWISRLINEISAGNPQILADRVLNSALENYNNNIEDDMTVLVAKVWKKVH